MTSHRRDSVWLGSDWTAASHDVRHSVSSASRQCDAASASSAAVSLEAGRSSRTRSWMWYARTAGEQLSKHLFGLFSRGPVVNRATTAASRSWLARETVRQNCGGVATAMSCLC